MRGLVPASTPLRTLQATFISPVPGGPLRIVARVLRSGKSATHVEADLYDGGQIACRTLGIFGLPRESVLAIAPPPPTEIGRASWRERVWQYVEISVVAGSLKKKTIGKVQRADARYRKKK